MKYDANKNKIPGWMSVTDLWWLFDTAKKTESIIEIGSWKGRSTHALLSGCQGTVYAVDHFLGSIDERGGPHAEAKERDIHKDFMENVGSFKNLKVLKMDNADAVKHFQDHSIDMVFIDAGHLYEEVLGDITRWLPKVKKIICGHDRGDRQVMQAVEGVFGTAYEKNEGGNMWIKNVMT